MKNRNPYFRTLFVLVLLGNSYVSRSQVLAQWSFNNLLSGLGSTGILTTPASLGTGITLGDYNGGNVFFGEGGWPTGGLDPAAYLEFTVKPVLSYNLTVASMQMNIRRSTTGSNAGPNNWSLRSSLDNYTTDISTGILTASSAVAIPVTFNASFAHLSSPVTFRLYGYNVTMTAGGLNRFVFDNISIGGATVLPVAFGSFSAQASDAVVNLDWTIPADQVLADVQVQRAAAGDSFQTISTLPGGQTSYHYTDNTITEGAFDYRIAMLSGDNVMTYSPVKQVSVSSTESLTVKGISSATGGIRVRISAPVSGAYRLTLYNMNGYPVVTKSSNLDAGTQNIDLTASHPGRGIYIIRAESNGRSTTGRLMIP